MVFDYIIAGAGAAGCVLANRLTEDPKTTVLLLEAGGSDRNPMLLVPKAFFFTMTSPRYAKFYATEPFGEEQQTEYWVRGRTIGGSTTINGMVWNRGWAPDYDVLESNGNEGWNWNTFLSAYRSIEDHQLGPSELRGSGGPVGVSIATEPEEVCETFITSLESSGVKRVEDLNATDIERIGYVPSSIKNGLRVSAASAFLHPIADRSNLTIMSQTEAANLLFDGKRVKGVRANQKGAMKDYLARREVIVAMGSLESPLFLERSGIGDPAVLIAGETVPGEEVATDEAILRNAMTNGGNGYHTLGTCAMGPEDDNVVDARLRVRGAESLRVVDASVFPNMPSGNNNAPTQALAWHAARLILDERV
jgi:choline dehydrogenase-like flavoprotein